MTAIRYVTRRSSCVCLRDNSGNAITLGRLLVSYRFSLGTSSRQNSNGEFMQDTLAQSREGEIFMKASLLTAVMVLCSLTVFVVAQKKSTIAGDIVIGEVNAIDDATREITIKYPGKQGTEIFTGNLSSGYKVKMLDGKAREIKVSEIPPGAWVRVFYKSGDETISGSR